MTRGYLVRERLFCRAYRQCVPWGVYPWGFSASWANDEVLKIFAQREAQRGTVAGQIGGETACSAVYARARFTNWSLRDDKMNLEI